MEIIKNIDFTENRTLSGQKDIKITDCNITSPEFGFSAENITMENSQAICGNFMTKACKLNFFNVTLKGDRAFEETENAIFDECNLDSENAFKGAKNVTVKNSIVKGGYLAWYSDGLTFVNCVIFGTRPFYCCKSLKLINCEMHDADLCFENSEVTAEIKTDVISIKNPRKGMIIVPSVGEIIMDDENAKGIVSVL